MSTVGIPGLQAGEEVKSLASLLAIPPLSKVQLMSKVALQDASIDSRGVIDLPFWFFQCVAGDKLEIRSPGGFMARVSPTDICDIVLADPIVVQAMPRHVLVERQRLSLRERQQSPGPECYRPAHVLWVMKDKWARVDAAFVRFLDESLNESTGPQQAPLDDTSRVMLSAIARRDRMPVVSRQGQASWSAVSRELPEHRAARKASQHFFAEALSR